MSKLGHTQNLFPKKLIIEGNIVYAITPDQFDRTIQHLLIGRANKLTVINLRTQILDMGSVLSLRAEQHRAEQKKNLNLEYQLKTMQAEHERQTKVMKKQHRKEKRKMFLLGGGTAIVLISVLTIIL